MLSTLIVSCSLTNSWADGNNKVNSLQEVYNTSDKQLKGIYNGFVHKEQVLQLLDGLYVSSVPEVLPLSPFTTVYLHHSFITMIQFPKGSKILDANVSFAFKRFIKKGNVIEIQPEKVFTEGNGIVYCQFKGKVYAVQMLFKALNPYTKGLKPVFYPTVVIVDGKVLSPVETLEAYRKVYGRYPVRQSTLFRLNGVVYDIETSKVYGNVRVGDTNYLVTTTIERN